MCKGKIHRATVTESNLNYTGSVRIDETLMNAANILPYELVHINNMSNAVHWETYAIPGTKGQISLHGCPARLFQVGDEVVILSFGLYQDREPLHPRFVFVDKNNEIVEVKNDSIK